MKTRRFVNLSPKVNSIKLRNIIALIIILFIGLNCQLQTGEQLAAEDVYKLHCKRCHGTDGKKGKKGAKDLNLSAMKLENRINHISEGKGKMPSFEKRLSEEQIQRVAAYTLMTFRADSVSETP